MNQLKAGVGRRFVPRSATAGPVGLGSMSVQPVLGGHTTMLDPKAAESPILGYKGRLRLLRGLLVDAAENNGVRLAGRTSQETARIDRNDRKVIISRQFSRVITKRSTARER